LRKFGNRVLRGILGPEGSSKRRAKKAAGLVLPLKYEESIVS
jgi:hypothetical protein